MTLYVVLVSLALLSDLAYNARGVPAERPGSLRNGAKAMFGSVGPTEIGIILLIILVLFGAKRLPELARSLGQGIKEFRKSVKEITEEPKDDDSGSSEDKS